MNCVSTNIKKYLIDFVPRRIGEFVLPNEGNIPLETTTKALALIGVAFLLFTAVFLYKLTFAIKKKCNFSAAIAPKPPRDAFAGKVWWISGASSGYGRALALHLCSHHDDVKLILSSRRQNVLEEVAEMCHNINRSANVKVLPIDFTDHASLQSKVEEALSLFDDRIDVLVNNGGVTTRSMARNSNFDVDTYVMTVDFLAYAQLTKSLLPSWEKSEKIKPIIVNTSSVAGKIGVPMRTSYCAAKFAIHGWFEALRIEQEISENPVDILNVVLGSTRTNVARNAITTSPNTKVGDECVDKNIEAGLDPNFVVERVVASTYARHDEIWIAPSMELIMLYLNQYVPCLAKKVLSKKLAKQYVVVKKITDNSVHAANTAIEKREMYHYSQTNGQTPRHLSK
jgi:dehydrogenase/reductase SDR family protein 7B